MYRVSVTAKLAASYLLVAALIVGPTLIYLRATFLSTLERVEASALEPRAMALRDELESLPHDQPAELDAAVRRFARLLQMRVTLIDHAGTPLADSEIPLDRIGTLENHGDRPEVRAALQGRFGWARRTSASVREELFYGAVPLPARGNPTMVVRVARRVSGLREAATSALLTMRLSTGVGVTVALLLSLGAAVYVSAPLRRMRDAARAFAEGRWVDVPRFNTRDELEDLALALDDLAKRFQQQLIAHGANEALLTQTVRSLPQPALLLDADFAPLEVNGALRELGDLAPANEGEALTALLRAPTLEAARREASERGLPVELSVPLPGRPEQGHVPATLVPLTRPAARPFWLLFISPSAALGEERGVPSMVELLERVDRTIDTLHGANGGSRRELAELRARTDELLVASGRPVTTGCDPIPVSRLLQRAIEDVAALAPERAPVVVSPVEAHGAILVAEANGLALRALRTLLRLGLRATPQKAPEVTVEVQPTAVHVEVPRAGGVDLGDEGRVLTTLAEAVGGAVGRRQAGKRMALRLTLPRA